MNARTLSADRRPRLFALAGFAVLVAIRKKELTETLNEEVPEQDGSSAQIFDSGSRLLASGDGSVEPAMAAKLARFQFSGM